MLRAIAKAMIPTSIREPLIGIKQRVCRTHSRESYSQEGEDLILERFMENRPSGFYVDIGAHHPQRFSNTYRLYLRGWRGINVDAIPGAMAPFRYQRPNDINLEMAVAAGRRELTFYVFEEPALNTFDRDLAMQRVGATCKIIDQIMLTTKPLSELLDDYLPRGAKVDVLTIDVEGLDYDVLRSNDWARYRPEFVLVECLGARTVGELMEHEVYKFLHRQGYEMAAKTANTVFFEVQT